MIPFPILSSTEVHAKKSYKSFSGVVNALGLVVSSETNSFYAMGSTGKLGLGATFTEFIYYMDNVDMFWSNGVCGIIRKLDGTWWSSGDSYFGLSSTNTWTDVTSKFVGIGDVEQLVMSASSIYVLNTAGQLYAVGYNNYKGIPWYTGTGNVKSFSLSPETNIDSIYSAWESPDLLLILYKDGTLKGCGYSNKGILGTFDNANDLAVLSTDVKYVNSSTSNIFIIKNDGTCYGRGDQYNGALGNGVTTGNITTWVPVTLPGGVIPVRVYTSGYATHIFGSDDDLYFSGQNSTTYPISGANTNSTPWGSYLTAFRKVPGYNKDLTSQITSIYRFGNQRTYFITDSAIYACGNTGDYSLMPNYGRATPRGGLTN